MSENQIPAPIIATTNNANEKRIVMFDSTQHQLPQIKPKVYATIDDAVNAGATKVVINKHGVIFEITPEQWKQTQQRREILRRRLDDQRREEREITHPVPIETQYRRFPGEDAHNANVQLREDLDHALKMKEQWNKLAMRVGRQSAQDRKERDEAIKRRDDLEAARDTWMKKARESAKEVADLRKEMEELRRSRDYWQTQAEKWHKQNDASVDYVEELKKEKSQLESKFERETNKVQTLEGTLALIRRKVNQAIGEPSN